jgi:PTS system mannose-specific IIA component
VNSGDGVIVVTDMFGGTPSNLAISAMDDGDIEVLAGANLPMLVKLASVRATQPLRKAAEEGQNAGRKYINLAGSLLGK